VIADALRIRLAEPHQGRIGPNWSGRIRLELADLDSKTESNWTIADDAGLTLNGTRVPLQRESGTHIWNAAPESLSLGIAARAGARGASELEITASLDDGGVALIQVLTFPLRWLPERTTAPPLRPTFVRFEDPEYNRILTTAANLQSVEIKDGASGSEKTWSLSVASDRRAYSPGSTIYLIWDEANPAGDSPPDVELNLCCRRNGSNAKTLGPLKRLALQRISVREIDNQLGGPSRKGDRLSLILTRAQCQEPPLVEPLVQLDLTIVAAAVDPMPEAAYALLRDAGRRGTATEPDNQGVECVRFAHGPEPTRIDLINGRELLLGVARRRAVFLWRDMVRYGLRHGYAVQKWSSNGATHIPERSEFVTHE
jgi:hypothetical protein